MIWRTPRRSRACNAYRSVWEVRKSANVAAAQIPRCRIAQSNEVRQSGLAEVESTLPIV